MVTHGSKRVNIIHVIKQNTASFPQIKRCLVCLVINNRDLRSQDENTEDTEWSPIRSVMIRVIDKIGRPHNFSQTCVSSVESILQLRAWLPSL